MAKKYLSMPLIAGFLALTLTGCGGTLTSSSATVSEASHEESSAASKASSMASSSEKASSLISTSVSYVNPPSYGNKPSLSIHYQRLSGKYNDWALWLWENGTSVKGKQYEFNGLDSFGAIAAYPLSLWSSNLFNNTLGFIVKGETDWTKDVQSDRFVDFNSLTPDQNQIYHIYLLSGDANVYTAPDLTVSDAVSIASFINPSRVRIKTNNLLSAYSFKENGIVIQSQTFSSPSSDFYVDLPDGGTGSPFQSYSVDVTFKDSQKTLTKSVSQSVLYKQDSFASAYTYTGNDLGAVVADGRTSFRVWSPISSSVSLRVYRSGDPSDVTYQETPMIAGDNGTWSVTMDSDLSGSYYTYFVTNRKYPKGQETIDPYAKGCGVNGVRGMIVDFSKTNPEGWDTFSLPHDYDRKNLVVDEMHIADLTSDASWGGTSSNAKRYAGFHESGTTYTQDGVTVKTGFDHIKDLGVNAVQLQPIFDQANDETNPTFNWGYNPLNYNCLEGVYSSNPNDGYARIKEFKSLVKDYYDAGINIIMDVVYNHANSVDGGSFDVLCPGYYYRYQINGRTYSGSGCGNDTASEMPMYRKFMVDSCLFWQKEYKLGGYRFDLMGLHDLETMKQISDQCLAVNPKFCIYGEPWNLSTGHNSDDLANQDSGAKWGNYGGFNDKMRDALIAGGLHDASEKGWIAKTDSKMDSVSLTDLSNGVRAIVTTALADPDKTTNYVTCHDNYTIYDRFKYGNGLTDDKTISQMAFLSEAVALLSQGTSFFQGGEEFLRSKGGVDNSYNSDYPVNAFKYDLALTNKDYLGLFKKLIAIKRNNPAFLGLDKAAVAAGMSASVNEAGNLLTYDISISGSHLKAAFRNGLGSEAPSADFSATSEVLLSTAGRSSIESSVALAPFEVLIAK